MEIGSAYSAAAAASAEQEIRTTWEIRKCPACHIRERTVLKVSHTGHWQYIIILSKYGTQTLYKSFQQNDWFQQAHQHDDNDAAVFAQSTKKSVHRIRRWSAKKTTTNTKKKHLAMLSVSAETLRLSSHCPDKSVSMRWRWEDVKIPSNISNNCCWTLKINKKWKERRKVPKSPSDDNVLKLFSPFRLLLADINLINKFLHSHSMLLVWSQRSERCLIHEDNRRGWRWEKVMNNKKKEFRMKFKIHK